MVPPKPANKFVPEQRPEIEVIEPQIVAELGRRRWWIEQTRVYQARVEIAQRCANPDVVARLASDSLPARTARKTALSMG